MSEETIGIDFIPNEEGKGFYILPRGVMPETEDVPEHCLAAMAVLDYIKTDEKLDEIIELFWITAEKEAENE